MFQAVYPIGHPSKSIWEKHKKSPHKKIQPTEKPPFPPFPPINRPSRLQTGAGSIGTRLGAMGVAHHQGQSVNPRRVLPKRGG